MLTRTIKEKTPSNARDILECFVIGLSDVRFGPDGLGARARAHQCINASMHQCMSNGQSRPAQPHARSIDGVAPNRSAGTPEVRVDGSMQSSSYPFGRLARYFAGRKLPTKFYCWIHGVRVNTSYCSNRNKLFSMRERERGAAKSDGWSMAA